MEIDPADIERLSSLEPHQLPKNLHPNVRKAVLDKMIEKRQGQPRAAKKAVAKPAPSKRRKSQVPPTVKRGEGGRIESVRTPIAPVDGQSPSTPTPVSSAPSGRRKTRTGKKLSKVTGKILQPSVRRNEESGKIEAIPEAERVSTTTVLPQVNPVPERKPEGLMGLGAKPITKGAASGGYPAIKAAVDAARTHLDTMHTAPVGSPEHHAAKEAFNAIHANILKMSPDLHLSLGHAYHEVNNYGHGSDERLAMTHKAINTRLGILRVAHEENIKRAAAGRLKKAGN